MSNTIPTPYEDLLKEILVENAANIAANAERSDRTGTGTYPKRLQPILGRLRCRCERGSCKSDRDS